MKKIKLFLLTIALLLVGSVCIVTTSSAQTTAKQPTWGSATFQLIKNKGDLDITLNAMSKENPELAKCIKIACQSNASEGTSNGMQWKKSGNEFIEITYETAKYSFNAVGTVLKKFFKYVTNKINH